MSRPSSQQQSLIDAGRTTRGNVYMPDMLEAVARTIAGSLGYGTVAINLYRPAWHDFEVVAVHGDRRARRVLMGTASTAEQWALEMDERFSCGGTYFVPEESFQGADQLDFVHVPDLVVLDDPDAWLPGDALFVPLHSADGDLRGILSVDEPDSGMRPRGPELETLVAVAAQAALAVESAQRAEEASQRHVEAQQLLNVSARLTAQRRVEPMLDLVCTGIAHALRFQRVLLFRGDRGRGHLAPVASAGWTDAEIASIPALDAREVESLLRPEFERHGCLLLEHAEARGLVRHDLRDLYSSRANGRGPHAWADQWLLVPLRAPGGELEGVIWVDDPRDRLKPSDERLKVLRSFGDQVSSALEAARDFERVGALSERDPLTGLHNRRGLRDRLTALLAGAPEGGVSLTVYDVDTFKRVNDVLGYEVGDAVLREVAEQLSASCPAGGFAVRLGGEDFAVIVPGTDAVAALAATEDVRLDVGRALDMVPWPVTLSAGVAVSDEHLTDAASLMRAGARALFAAKRLGRDRSVLYSVDALEVLLGSLQDDTGGEHLGAMLLLAETLDLRDPHTARHSQTVGYHAQRLATALEFSPDCVERVRIAGVLHDIGKLGLPDAILHKTGPLTSEEWMAVRRHPEMGARILDQANLRDAAAWVLCHHERVDGGGYPRGLSRDEIPIEARILAVADAFEAMTADRPYRRAMPATDAVAEIVRQSGTQFDSRVVDAFLAMTASSDAPAGAG